MGRLTTVMDYGQSVAMGSGGALRVVSEAPPPLARGGSAVPGIGLDVGVYLD